jgi:RNA polymerase sigma-70 factor (ECF subfamily)
MDRYAAGDDEAFGEVYDAVAPRLYAYLLRQTRDVTRAEDLVQHTLLQIHRMRGRFIPGSAVLPWVFAVARRLLIDDLRRLKRDVLHGADGLEEQNVRDGHAAADDVLVARDLAQRLQQELLRLPESQRVAFELMRYDGMSHAEAAETLGITVSALKLRAHRAYVALRRAMEDSATDPSER